MNELLLFAARTTLPAIIAAAGERASLRFLESSYFDDRKPGVELGRKHEIPRLRRVSRSR
jgi:hypothetical protein